MLNKAIAKIDAEMSQNNNDSYIQVVGSFLLQYIKSNTDDAGKILTTDKTIAKSLEAMKQAASQKKVNNCAVLTDQEGFIIVLKYFGIDAAAPVSAPVTIEQSIPKPDVEKNASIDFDIKLEDLL